VPYHDPAPVKPHRTLRDFGRRVWALLVASGTFLLKFGAVLYKLKVVAVAGSMIVSVGAYALLGGWWFGVGLVGLIFVHEMGHVLALRRQGVPASAPLFIPFMGAVIGMKKMPENAWREAEVALAPIYDLPSVYADPHFRARQSFVEVHDPVLGPMHLVDVAPKLSATPGRVRHTGPALGQHNAEVLAELGLTPEEVELVVAEGLS